MRTPVIRSILVATDLSANSDAIVRTAALLARQQGAALHVLNAFDPTASHHMEHAGHTTFPERVEAFKRTLAEQIQRVVPEGVQVASQDVIIYAPEKAIAEQAAAVSADLLVLGPHRDRSVADAFLGSTADHVIRHAEVPCLVLRGELAVPIRHVAVAVDLADTTPRTLGVALTWVEALGRGGAAAPKLDVVHVAEKESEVRESLRAAIADAAQRAVGVDNVEVREEVVWDSTPTDAIIAFTQRSNSDLLVLGTHGRGALARVFVGSVASGVSRQARCPVLLVPPAR